MHFRGKNSDQEQWTYITDEEEGVTVHEIEFYCDGASELCKYFPAGFLPELTFEMYDVAIEVTPSDALSKLHNTSINFHIAYMNPEFTMYQLGFRVVFATISLLFLCYYCTKVLCRVPKGMEN